MGEYPWITWAGSGRYRYGDRRVEGGLYLRDAMLGSYACSNNIALYGVVDAHPWWCSTVGLHIPHVEMEA